VSKPFDEGMKLERAASSILVQTPRIEGAAPRSSPNAPASKIPDVPEDTPVRTIAKVGVIGAGTMGGGITMNFVNAGIPVTLLETKQEALEKGLATIRKNYEHSCQEGPLTQEEHGQAHGPDHADAGPTTT
jgi:3-hydroxyacyl-CoA dehydrogenase